MSPSLFPSPALGRAQGESHLNTGFSSASGHHYVEEDNFAREAPRPHPAGLENLGCPITLTFDSGTVTEVQAKLSAGRRSVPILISSPEKPANPKRPDNRKSICLLPKQPLRPKTLYSVEVSYKRDGKEETKQWVFKTGQRRPVWGPANR